MRTQLVRCRVDICTCWAHSWLFGSTSDTTMTGISGIYKLYVDMQPICNTHGANVYSASVRRGVHVRPTNPKSCRCTLPPCTPKVPPYRSSRTRDVDISLSRGDRGSTLGFRNARYRGCLPMPPDPWGDPHDPPGGSPGGPPGSPRGPHGPQHALGASPPVPPASAQRHLRQLRASLSACSGAYRAAARTAVLPAAW